jgi:hypothetical protein
MRRSGLGAAAARSHAGLACCRLARKQSLGQLQRRSDTTAVMVLGILHQHHQIGGTRCAQSIAE